MKKLPSILLAISLVAVASFVQSVNLVSSNPITPPLPSIMIQPDGNLFPSNVPINRTGSIYTLLANISNYCLIVQCSNIIVDGANFTIQGKTYAENSGITIEADGVTIKHISIREYNVAGINVIGSLNTITE